LRYNTLRESYLTLGRDMDELHRRYQEEIDEMGREHSRAYWNVNNSVSTINYYWESQNSSNYNSGQYFQHRIPDLQKPT